MVRLEGNYIFRAATEQQNHQFGRVLSSDGQIRRCHQAKATGIEGFEAIRVEARALVETGGDTQR